MKMHFQVAVLCACLGWVAPVAAQTEPCDPALTQAELTQCHGEQLQRWDRMLNQIYQRVIGTLDDVQEENLREAQRAWITYRDLTCGMERARYEGGSIAPLIEVLCLTRLTERRTRDLEEYMRP